MVKRSAPHHVERRTSPLLMLQAPSKRASAHAQPPQETPKRAGSQGEDTQIGRGEGHASITRWWCRTHCDKGMTRMHSIPLKLRSWFTLFRNCGPKSLGRESNSRRLAKRKPTTLFFKQRGTLDAPTLLSRMLSRPSTRHLYGERARIIHLGLVTICSGRLLTFLP